MDITSSQEVDGLATIMLRNMNHFARTPICHCTSHATKAIYIELRKRGCDRVTTSDFHWASAKLPSLACLLICSQF